MQIDTYVGVIFIFPFDFAPSGWAICDGTLLKVSEYPALFSLIGNKYGGDGRTTFALPDLRGKNVIGAGNSASTDYPLAGTGGNESIKLSKAQLPPHIHKMLGSTNQAAAADPEGAFLARTAAQQMGIYNQDAGTGVKMNNNAISSVGKGESINIMQPYVAMNYCIALEGQFPSKT